MVTISNIVKKIVQENPLLYEALARNIINFANLAEELKPEIEKVMGEKVKEQAIIMALRRHNSRRCQYPSIPFCGALWTY